MKRFDARNVIVTGAGSGIGAATVKRLLDEGATVVAVDVTQAGVDAVISAAADPVAFMVSYWMSAITAPRSRWFLKCASGSAVFTV